MLYTNDISNCINANTPASRSGAQCRSASGCAEPDRHLRKNDNNNTNNISKLNKQMNRNNNKQHIIKHMCSCLFLNNRKTHAPPRLQSSTTRRHRAKRLLRTCRSRATLDLRCSRASAVC